MRKGGREKLAVLRACARVRWLSKGKCRSRRAALRNAATATKGETGLSPRARNWQGEEKQHQIKSGVPQPAISLVALTENDT